MLTTLVRVSNTTSGRALGEEATDSPRWLPRRVGRALYRPAQGAVRKIRLMRNGQLRRKVRHDRGTAPARLRRRRSNGRRPSLSSVFAARRPASSSTPWAGRARSTGASSRSSAVRSSASRSPATAAPSTIWRSWRRSPNAGRATCSSRRPEATSGAAVTGDLLIGVARNRGVVGLRHRRPGARPRRSRNARPAGLRHGRHAEFAAAARPRRGRPADRVRRRTVASGDVVVGDRDGVVVVPRERIAATLDNLERVKAAEAAMLERVRGGLKDCRWRRRAAADDGT